MISSKSNEQIKFVASLKEKKYREKYSKYFIEGIKLVGEILNSEGFSPSEFVVYSSEILNLENTNKGEKNIIQKLEEKNVKIIDVSEGVFRYISDTKTPQGILAVLDMPKSNGFEDMYKDILNRCSKCEKFLVLDKVADSGNIGTIIRTAVSFGVENLICLDGTTDVYSPKVIRSTMGAIRKINIMYVSLEEFKKIAQVFTDNKYNLIVTTLSANKYLKDLKSSYANVFVMGNEANGVCQDIIDMATDNIKIPISSEQESLNVAIATGICLYSMNN